MGYENGKIYKLVSPTTDKVYIGSTIRSLKDRLREHKKVSNPTSSKFLGMVIAISLIENFPCCSRKELEKRERYWIENTKNIINMRIPTLSYREWRILNREDIRRKKSIYHFKNKEQINRNLRGKRNQSTRDYEAKMREKNREKIRERGKLRNIYQNSWGGDYRYNNNLLKISLDLFN